MVAGFIPSWITWCLGVSGIQEEFCGLVRSVAWLSCTPKEPRLKEGGLPKRPQNGQNRLDTKLCSKPLKRPSHARPGSVGVCGI